MKNDTTLNQAVKILSYFERTPSSVTQQLIESGYLSDVVRTGSLEKAAAEQERTNRIEMWRIIGRLTKWDKVFITVPHDKCQHRSEETTVFQLRCWQGKIGHPSRGHVDGGVDLLEVMLPEKLKDCECCWKQTLLHLGLDVGHNGSDGEWVKEVCTAQDNSKYDLITYRPSNKGPECKKV